MALETSINSGTDGIAGNVALLVGKKKSKQKHNINDIVMALSGDNKTLFEVAKSIDTTTKSILESVGLMGVTLNAIKDRETDSESNSMSLEVSASGDAAEFMKALFQIVSVDASRINASGESLETLGDAIDHLAGRKYTQVNKGLEAMSKGVHDFKENMPSFKDLVGIAGGIAMIGLAIIGVIGAIHIEDIFMLGLTFTAIALASKALAGTETNLLKASLGLATLGLAIWAFNEVITAEAVTDTITALLAMGGAIWLFDTLFGKSIAAVGKPLIILALGLASLGLAMELYNDVEWESIGKAAAALAGIGLIGKLMTGVKVSSVITIAALALSVGALGLALGLFEDISIEDVGVALMALGGVALVAWAVGQVAKTAIIGALAIGILALSLGLLAWGLESIRDLNMTWEDAGEIAAIIGLTAGAFALIGIPAVAAFIGIGAVAVLAMSVGLIALAAGLMAVSHVNLTEQQAETFGKSLRFVVEAMTQFSALELVELALSVPAMVGLAVSAMAVGLSLALISKLSMPNDKTLETFKHTLRSLGDSLMQFDAMELIELAAVTPVMLALGLTTVALGTSIALFTLLSTDRKSVDVAIGALDGFLSGLYTTFEKYDGDAFDVLKTGIDATMNIGKLLRNLAFGISAISIAMSKNTDFKAIGTSVGSILMALTEPLAAIGSQQDEISIGGFTITNPFSNKVAAGIEALSGLSTIFTPLAEMVKIFANDKNGTLAKQFGSNLSAILGSISSTFAEFHVKDQETEAITGVSIMAGNMNNFVKSITGSKYEPAMKGLSSINVSTKGLTTSINAIDLKKITALNEMFKHLTLMGKNDAIEELIKALNEFLNALSEQRSYGGGFSEPAAAQPFNPFVPAPTTPSKLTNTSNSKNDTSDQERLITAITDSNDGLESKIDQLLQMFKLGTASVKVSKFP